jgi:hypothetical protein
MSKVWMSPMTSQKFALNKDKLYQLLDCLIPNVLGLGNAYLGFGLSLLLLLLSWQQERGKRAAPVSGFAVSDGFWVAGGGSSPVGGDGDGSWASAGVGARRFADGDGGREESAMRSELYCLILNQFSPFLARSFNVNYSHIKFRRRRRQARQCRVRYCRRLDTGRKWGLRYSETIAPRRRSPILLYITSFSDPE